MPAQETWSLDEFRQWKKTKKKPVRSKYGNTRTEYKGRKFDSIGEMEYYRDYLEILETAGEIGKVKFQHRYDLESNGKHICYYYADFRFRRKGKFYIVDFKSEATAKSRTFINKWKMLKAEIEEIETNAVLQLVVKKGGKFLIIEETEYC